MPERPICKTLLAGSALIGLIGLCSMALSSKARHQCLARDRVCQWNDGTPHQGGLEASHLNHSHETVMIDGEPVGYGNIKRCLILCTGHHLTYHQTTPIEQLGLTQQQNDWAIGQIEKRLNNQ